MENLKAAQDVHHKFEFYFVVLTFTIVAFSVQSGKFSGNSFGDVMEILSWVCLSVSGTIGLWRIEYIPVMYHINSQLEEKEQAIIQYKKHETHQDIVAKTEKQVEEGKQKRAAIESGNYKKYFCQKLFFLFGLVALLVSGFILLMEIHYW